MTSRSSENENRDDVTEAPWTGGANSRPRCAAQSLCTSITAPEGANRYDAITESSTHGESSTTPSSGHGRGTIDVETGVWQERGTKWDYMNNSLNEPGTRVTKCLNGRNEHNEDIDIVLLLHILERWGRVAQEKRLGRDRQ